MRRALAILALCAAPSLAMAQSDGGAELEAAFRSIALHWAASDATAVVRYFAPAGVSIDVGDGPMGPLTDRQAAALLRQLFDQGETMRVQEGMLERVGGDPPRAFGAITWTTRPRGTVVPVSRTVYFGLARIGGTWRVSEIRLIP